MKSCLKIYAASILLLSGACGTQKQSVRLTEIRQLQVPAGDPNPVQMVGKRGSLTGEALQSWSHADLYSDSIPGISLGQAYQFLENKTPDTILVGIIDSGIDIGHEDLQEVVWTNPEEVAGNGLDEDGNSYADDMHGWNFLGGEKGEAVYAQYELTRIYSKLMKQFDGKAAGEIPEASLEDYNRFLQLKKEYEAAYTGLKTQYDQFLFSLNMLKKADSSTRKALGREVYTLEDLNSLPEGSRNPGLVNILSNGGSVAEGLHQIEYAISLLDVMVNKKYNLDFDGRKTDDDKDDLTDIPYGNPWVSGSPVSEQHGSHVAGIMLASRNNGLGIQGVADHVRLIAVRATPNGDEYDKDVALAIRYMADKGAKVVNMSFGKAYSTHSDWVYDAIKYAESRDVLLVKAAGNDGVNIDEKQYFPNDAPDNVNEICDNVINVGALNPSFDENLVGDYSNYGKINVDIFAPGTDIYSTIPQNNYDYKQGTSMASPHVAGVAALIRSYYPELSARQVKWIILNSGLKVDMEVAVPKSGGKRKMPFDQFSKTGRILNAYNAVRLADRMLVNYRK